MNKSSKITFKFQVPFRVAVQPVLNFTFIKKKYTQNQQYTQNYRNVLMKDFIDWFGKDCIDCLLADREFVGKEWLGFLNENKIRYHIRIRNNFKVYCPKRQDRKSTRLNSSHVRISYA